MKLLRTLFGRDGAARRHPSTEEERSAVVLVADPRLADRLRRLLGEVGLDAVTVPGAGVALELATARDHPLLVVEAPLPDAELAEFVEALREHRRRRQGGLLVLTAPEHRAEVQRVLDGSGTVLVRHAPDELLRGVISRLATAAPRRRPNGVVTATIVSEAATSPLVCPVVNVSSSGVLVLTQRLFPVGTRCQVELSEESTGESVAAEGWVVRHQPPRDTTESLHERMAIQFLGDASQTPGQERLVRFLERV